MEEIMDFIEFRNKLQEHVTEMISDVSLLFTIEVDRDALYNLYLDSFPKEANGVFRERRIHDCSACRHFIKTFGNVVKIKNQKVTTIWDFDVGDNEYSPVLLALSNRLHSSYVSNIFVTDQRSFGLEHNIEHDETNATRDITWHHFYYKLPKKFITTRSDTLETIKGEYRDTVAVFQRSLDEITEDAISTVLELISQGSLYRGEEFQELVSKFLDYKKEYENIPFEERELYYWEKVNDAGKHIGRIRNHAIGTLLLNISEAEDLDSAVRKYEAIMAPSNYKRPKAIYTKKMIANAQEEIEKLGLSASLERRYAKLEDITVNNVIFSNKDAVKKMAGSVFERLAESVPVSPKTFTKVEEIPIDAFIKDVIPSIDSMEILFEGRHSGNLVSLIAPENEESKSFFKWNNGFSWAYAGNMTDSMKERVKAAGGNVEGVLRFSIQWNDSEYNPNDFDAHCIEPVLRKLYLLDRNNEIYFGDKVSQYSGGNLDVDIIHPQEGIVSVENITWPSTDRMAEGVYTFFVHCYNNRGGRTGFSSEIEFDGQIYSFSYDKELKQGEKIPVADVRYSKAEGFSIIKSMDNRVSGSSRKIWDISTNQFIPVSVLMYSPNYWDEQDGIGNRHYLFMLKGCKNPEGPNGFFNEYLKNDLLEHKRVFEALGGMMKVKDSDEQLSGLGFSSTQRNSVICKIGGHVSRTVKILF
jgi:hypothetical protein